MMRVSLIASSWFITISLGAQTHDHSSAHAHAVNSANVESLLAQVRIATEPYVDRNVAIAAGYRRVGPDIPSMGEHWLNPKLIVEGKFDVSRPQLLTYLKIDGRPVLTGVVYGIPLRQGESPPDAFGPEASWHEHNGSIDEEGLLPEHHNTPSAKVGTRVAFLHAWIRVPGSEPVFSAENWAIPFLRLGIPVPDQFPNGAARALSLIADGKKYFADLLGPAAQQSASSLDETSSAAESILDRAKADGRSLDPGDLARLDAAWQRLLTDVVRRSGIEAAKRINGGVAPRL